MSVQFAGRLVKIWILDITNIAKHSTTKLIIVGSKHRQELGFLSSNFGTNQARNWTATVPARLHGSLLTHTDAGMTSLLQTVHTDRYRRTSCSYKEFKLSITWYDKIKNKNNNVGPYNVTEWRLGK